MRDARLDDEGLAEKMRLSPEEVVLLIQCAKDYKLPEKLIEIVRSSKTSKPESLQAFALLLLSHLEIMEG